MKQCVSYSHLIILMIQLASLLFALAIPASSLSTQVEAPKKVWVSGTKVQLVPPKTWKIAPNFPGYFHEESGSSVMVTEMPGPYAEISAGFRDEEQLKKRGMTLLSSEDRKMGELSGLFLTLRQSTGRVDVTKAIWICGTEKETVFIMGTVMTAAEDEWFKFAHDCVLSANWDSKRTIDPYEGLSFRLGYTGGLKFLSRMGDVLSFTADGQPDSKNTGKTQFTIGPALGSGAIDDRSEFVNQRLLALPFEIIGLVSKDEVDIDDLEGYELVARVSVDGKERVTYLVVLFEEDNYWIAHGQARVEEQEAALAKFSKITRSLKRIKPKPPEPETDR